MFCYISFLVLFHRNVLFCTFSCHFVICCIIIIFYFCHLLYYFMLLYDMLCCFKLIYRLSCHFVIFRVCLCCDIYVCVRWYMLFRTVWGYLANDILFCIVIYIVLFIICCSCKYVMLFRIDICSFMSFRDVLYYCVLFYALFVCDAICCFVLFCIDICCFVLFYVI